MFFTYFLRRVGSAALTLWFLVTLTFVLLHLLPGDPFASEKAFPPGIRENLMAHYRLDRPLLEQYLTYLSGLLRGDLGPSFVYRGRSVNAIIAAGLPVSATLGSLALAIALVSGVAAGCVAALRGGTVDRLIFLVSSLFIAVPHYLFAVLLVRLAASGIGGFPVAPREEPGSLVLPALALAANPAAFIARLVRAGLLEAWGEGFTRAALARGVPLPVVLVRHALRHALLPVLSYLGPFAATLLTGSFAVEVIFGIPGLGEFFVSSVLNRDYGTVLALTLLFGAFLIGANLLVDLLHRRLDPRLGAPAPGGG